MYYYRVETDALNNVARSVAEQVVVDMGLDQSGVCWISRECDSLQADPILDLLSSRKAEAMVVIGDWRGSKVDVYDQVLRFAEDNFGRLRHQKMSAGMYIVVMAKPL